MKEKRKLELQKMAENIVNHLQKNPKASLFPGFMPSEECDYLQKCLEKYKAA
jgi:hypothetical protein